MVYTRFPIGNLKFTFFYALRKLRLSTIPGCLGSGHLQNHDIYFWFPQCRNHKYTQCSCKFRLWKPIANLKFPLRKPPGMVNSLSHQSNLMHSNGESSKY